MTSWMLSMEFPWGTRRTSPVYRGIQHSSNHWAPWKTCSHWQKLIVLATNSTSFTMWMRFISCNSMRSPNVWYLVNWGWLSFSAFALFDALTGIMLSVLILIHFMIIVCCDFYSTYRINDLPSLKSTILLSILSSPSPSSSPTCSWICFSSDLNIIMWSITGMTSGHNPWTSENCPYSDDELSSFPLVLELPAGRSRKYGEYSRSPETR